MLAPHRRVWALYHASRVRRPRQTALSLRGIFDEIEVALDGHLQAYRTDGSFEETPERLDLPRAEHESGIYGSVQILKNAPPAEFEMYVCQDGLKRYVIRPPAPRHDPCISGPTLAIWSSSPSVYLSPDLASGSIRG